MFGIQISIFHLRRDDVGRPFTLCRAQLTRLTSSHFWSLTTLKTSDGVLEPERTVATGFSGSASSPCLDLVGMYCVSQPAVYDAFWRFVDAINPCPTVRVSCVSKHHGGVSEVRGRVKCNLCLV